MQKYPHLFSPITLGNTRFSSRLFASPMSGRNYDSLNRPNADCVAFYERKAIGGAASVCIGDCVVDSERGLFGEHMLSLDDMRTNTTLNRLSHAVSRHGAVAAIELQHAGLYATGTRARGLPVYAPVDGVDAHGLEYFEMPEDIIEQTIAKYGAAAAWAKQCGFGMITVHAGHGWLLSQFLSSKVNTRRDKWGGSLENRVRLPLAILEAVRKAVGPSFPIEIRMSGTEVTPRGYDLDEGIAIAKMLDGHVDLIHVSAGHHEYSEVFCVTHPSLFADDSANIGIAAAIKKHVKTPVASVGAHCDAEMLEEIIASGQADVVQLARALLADPDLPKKARAGKTDEIRPCLRCLQCFSGLITNGQIYCAVNPEIGNEITCRSQPEAPKSPKKILVAGGGVGGMQAAMTLAKRGHEVILCEKSERLGGVLKCEEDVPFKKKIRDYIAYQERHVAALPIDVRLGTAVTPQLAEELAPDVIIAALGARPVKPKIDGIDGANVIFAEDAYVNPDAIGQRVAVLGGGLVGTELAIHLARLGREVTIIEMMPRLNNGGNILHEHATTTQIQEHNIALRLNTRVTEITADGVRGTCGDDEVFVSAETVICAVGQAALSAEADALRFIAPEFHVIGDCRVPKNITQATAMADAIARYI